MEARAGLEPANDGFANHCLSQLGDRATQNRYISVIKIDVEPDKNHHIFLLFLVYL